ncbi:glycoprotein [Hymenopteran arli-related virus OKIAV99]|uniref:Glycoprotein n=1 Tax=Hymenopteran arli-related virus OKIAV99 TaxID=2792566 RepID=A0AAE7P409_9MONO|nr:glycoprotein [Hymenopteran arli-related virus OKIAV99]QPL15344.1 glycoprotein [Hymenopteran arli-related virus OKIAV99]
MMVYQSLLILILMSRSRAWALKDDDQLIRESLARQHFSVSSVQDQIQVIPERGILLEPAGQYYSYSGYSLIPIIYTIPSVKLQGDNRTYCPSNRIIHPIYRSMVDRIYANIKPQRHSRAPKTKQSREKRFVPIILGGAALLGQIGYDLYNTGEVHSLQTVITDLQTSNSEIEARLAEVTDTSNIVIKDLRKISVIVGDNTASIVSLANKVACMEHDSSPEFRVILAQLADIPPEFMAAYDNMIAGRIVPELISMQNLQFTIESHPELRKSVYSRDPSLIYELGKAILVDVIYGEIPALKGVLFVPKILNQLPIPMYNIYTVNYQHKGTQFRVILPEKMVCRSATDCWELPTKQCINSMTKSICLQGHHRIPNKCISTLHQNNSLECDLLIGKADADPIIYQLGAGVFSGTLPDPIKGVDIVGESIVYKGTFEVERPRLFTIKDAPFLLINDDVYSTRMSGVQFNITLIYTDTAHVEISPPVDALRDWIPLEQIPVSWKSHMHAPVTTLSGISLAMGVITIITAVVIIFYILTSRKVKKQGPPLFIERRATVPLQEIPYLR